MKKTSWKTTVGGLLTAIGGAVLGSEIAIGFSPPQWVSLLALIAAAAGPVLLGGAARDNGVSSEEARAK
jgi:hypothetical protein